MVSGQLAAQSLLLPPDSGQAATDPLSRGCPTLSLRPERHSNRRMASWSGLKCWLLEKPEPLAAEEVPETLDSSICS